MNKWRLLLLSIFALLHITKSERNLLDGRCGCCENTRLFSPSDTRLVAYDSFRERQLVPEKRRPVTADKFLTNTLLNFEDNVVSRRTGNKGTRNREQRFLDNKLLGKENRRIIARQQTRLLSSIPESIRGRHVSIGSIRKRINNRQTQLLNERPFRQSDTQIQRNVPVTLFARNDINRNRLEIRYTRQVNSDDDSRHTSENKIQTPLTQRYTFNNQFYTVKDFADVRGEQDRSNMRKISVKRNVINTFTIENEQKTKFNGRFKRELRLNTRRKNTMELNENRGINQIRRHSLRRYVNEAPFIDITLNNDDRSSRVNVRPSNVIRQSAQNIEELRQTSRPLRALRENKLERNTRLHYDRLRNLDRNFEKTRIDHRQHERDEMIYNRRNDFKINKRNERSIQKRSLSEEISRDLNTRINRIGSQREERIDRRSHKRYTDGKVRREINERKVNIMQGYSLERRNNNVRDSKITEVRRNSPLDEDHVRITLGRSYGNQKITTDAVISTRRNRVFNLSPEIRDSRNSKKNTEFNLMVRRATEQADTYSTWRDANTDRIRNYREQERFAAEYRLRIRQEKNRILYRTRTNVMIDQRDLISVRVKDNESLHLLRRTSNDDPLAYRRQDTRNNRDERRNTKNTDEKRHTKNTDEGRITKRQVIPSIDARSLFRTKFIQKQRLNQGSLQIQVLKTDSNVFEIKWQYLFYMVQAIYICSMLIRVPKENKETKKKIRLADWLTPAKLLKID